MIQNDTELKTSQQHIAYFQGLLLQLRVKASAEEFLLVSDNYRTEIEKMQTSIFDYMPQRACKSRTDGNGSE